MIDNAYFEGSSTPISDTDADGNTYQIRKLQDRCQYKVLRNFPTEAILRNFLSVQAMDITVKFVQYSRLVEYRTKEIPNHSKRGRQSSF